MSHDAHPAWLDRRGSGILLHPTSLPGPQPVGCLGPEARRFLRFLEAAGQSWWQMLPVVPPGPFHSPYQSESAFALSPFLLSLEELRRDGLLGRRDLEPSPGAGRADYARGWAYLEPRLHRAHQAFRARARGEARDDLARFRSEASSWLDDYALYVALREAHGAPWPAWEPELRDREGAALERARRALAEPIDYQVFLQHQLARQWSRLREEAHGRRVRLMGDVPIFVAHESADVWANRDVFDLKPDGWPRVQAGVPPDYFSRTGQLWGNPLYRWDVLESRGFDWWIARLQASLERFDALRLDHFIGFVRCWEVPAGAPDASKGSFRAVPGAKLLESVRRHLGSIPLAAEDLGLVTQEVRDLRDAFGLPGLEVLQFAFLDPGDDGGRPHRYRRNSIVYTGTHDNDTSVGWYRDTGSRASTRDPEQARAERRRLLAYLGARGGDGIHWDLVRLAMMSVANLCVFPAQDVLGLDSRARMNRPGTVDGNWQWRARPGQLDLALAGRLRRLTETYGRLPPGRDQA